MTAKMDGAVGVRWMVLLVLGSLCSLGLSYIVLPNNISFSEYPNGTDFVRVVKEENEGETQSAIFITFGELTPASLEGVSWLGLNEAFTPEIIINFRNGKLNTFDSWNKAIGHVEEKKGNQTEEEEAQSDEDCLCRALNAAMNWNSTIVVITYHKESPCDNFDSAACRTDMGPDRRLLVSGPEGFLVKIHSIYGNRTKLVELEEPIDLVAQPNFTFKLATFAEEASKKINGEGSPQSLIHLPVPVCRAQRIPSESPCQPHSSGHCQKCSPKGSEPVTRKNQTEEEREKQKEKCAEIEPLCVPCLCLKSTGGGSDGSPDGGGGSGGGGSGGGGGEDDAKKKKEGEDGEAGGEDLPVWAIILLVVVILLVAGGIAGAIFYRRRRKESEHSEQFPLYTGRQAKRRVSRGFPTKDSKAEAGEDETIPVPESKGNKGRGRGHSPNEKSSEDIDDGPKRHLLDLDAIDKPAVNKPRSPLDTPSQATYVDAENIGAPMRVRRNQTPGIAGSGIDTGMTTDQTTDAPDLYVDGNDARFARQKQGGGRSLDPSPPGTPLPPPPIVRKTPTPSEPSETAASESSSS